MVGLELGLGLAFPLTRSLTLSLTISQITPTHGATARLRLRVVQGSDLPALDKQTGASTSGLSDAFCMIFLEGSSWRTSTVKGSCNPSWPDQPQELPLTSLSSLLHVVVFDYDGLQPKP